MGIYFIFSKLVFDLIIFLSNEISTCYQQDMISRCGCELWYSPTTLMGLVESKGCNARICTIT